MESGDALFDVVEEYAALGVHRTGTAVDLATVDWMADQLTERGFAVARQEYTFDRWEAESELSHL